MPSRPVALLSRPALVVFVLLVLAATTTVVGGVAAQTETPTNGTLAPEETVIEIQLQPDGDARWEITEHFTITDEHERAAFDDLGGPFEEQTAGSLGLDTVRLAVVDANGGTDRSMAIEAPEQVVERENESLSAVRGLNGTTTLTFTWTNFAREEGDSYVVDDAFNASQGTWFGGLTASERLIIALPSGHGASAAPKAFEENELRWEGPTSFEPGYLRIVYSGSLPEPNPDNGEPVLVWVALGLAALALIAAAYLLGRRRGVDPAAAVLAAVGGEDEEAAEDASTAETEEPEPTDDAEDLELLSDEERVERLIEDNGGRMKQANIVRETGWSNAKVSQLLSAMEEEGRITKLRIGRENLISFPDEDVGEFET